MQKNNRKTKIKLIILHSFIAIIIGLIWPPISLLGSAYIMPLFVLAMPIFLVIFFGWQVKKVLNNNVSKLFRALTTLSILVLYYLSSYLCFRFIILGL